MPNKFLVYCTSGISFFNITSSILIHSNIFTFFSECGIGLIIENILFTLIAHQEFVIQFVLFLIRNDVLLLQFNDTTPWHI